MGSQSLSSWWVKDSDPMIGPHRRPTQKFVDPVNADRRRHRRMSHAAELLSRPGRGTSRPAVARGQPRQYDDRRRLHRRRLGHRWHSPRRRHCQHPNHRGWRHHGHRYPDRRQYGHRCDGHPQSITGSGSGVTIAPQALALTVTPAAGASIARALRLPAVWRLAPTGPSR